MRDLSNDAAQPPSGSTAKRFSVRFTSFVGRPLEGTPSRFRGRGGLELTTRGIVLHYQVPIAELPEWSVSMIVGGAAVYYLLLAYVTPELLPANWSEPGPIVPAMTAALATWAAVRGFGPRRARQLRLARADVQAVLLDAARRRALLQTSEGQLIGFSLDAAVEPLRAYCEHSWPQTLREGPVGLRLIGRRLFVTLTVAVAVALILLFGPG